MDFTDEQLRFLRHHKLSPDTVLDAKAMTRQQYQEELRRQNKAIALVAKPCARNHGTRLRLASGHCMECSPQGIAHWRRHQEPAFVYIAESAKLRLLKVGLSKVASERADALNRDGYGGAADWRVIYRRKFDRAGMVEAKVHTALRAYERKIAYQRRGHNTQVTAGELFDCDCGTIKRALDSLSEHALGDAWER